MAIKVIKVKETREDIDWLSEVISLVMIISVMTKLNQLTKIMHEKFAFLSEGIKHWAPFFDVIEAKRDVMLVVTPFGDGDVMVMSCWCHASELSFLPPFQSEFSVHDSVIFSLLQICIWIISQLHTSYSSVIL